MSAVLDIEDITLVANDFGLRVCIMYTNSWETVSYKHRTITIHSRRNTSYRLMHELAHWIVATKEERSKIDYGIVEPYNGSKVSARNVKNSLLKEGYACCVEIAIGAYLGWEGLILHSSQETSYGEGQHKDFDKLAEFRTEIERLIPTVGTVSDEDKAKLQALHEQRRAEIVRIGMKILNRKPKIKAILQLADWLPRQERQHEEAL